jgi:short-subunit dehydrogenase
MPRADKSTYTDKQERQVEQIECGYAGRGIGKMAPRRPDAGVDSRTKAFINAFCHALRDELKGTFVTVTCLMPGKMDRPFFERADMPDTTDTTDTKVRTDKKADPAAVALIRHEAMLDGTGPVVAGWKNKLQAILANVVPAEVLAAQDLKMAEPGWGQS